MGETTYTKAHRLEEVDNAVRFDVPIGANHEFYTDFSDVRGDFEDKLIYNWLKVDAETFTYSYHANTGSKILLFLAGMRGAGKTSELAKIAQKLHNPNCFFCVTCNLEDGLDLNDMEYMDVLIYQVERLFEELEKAEMSLDEGVIASLQKWFGERVEEINRAIKKEGGFEVAISTGPPGILSFLGLTAKLKANLLGSKENAEKIRTVFKNNFADFAKKANEFFEFVNSVLRANAKAKEILFIVDGLEKTGTHEIRRKVILEDANRLRQIKANTVFTLPVELMPETQRIIAFSTVVPFPFIKLKERNGAIVEKAIERFIDFTYKRIDENLFDSPATVREAIIYGGGSPREYLRILQYAYIYTDRGKPFIDREALRKGIARLAAQTAQYLTTGDLEILKLLKENNEKSIPVPYGTQWQDLLEKLIVLEYNDGTYKRVNPVIEESQLYKHYVQ